VKLSEMLQLLDFSIPMNVSANVSGRVDVPALQLQMRQRQVVMTGGKEAGQDQRQWDEGGLDGRRN